ncbi:hypothetical protein ACFPOB_27635 [Bosea eneae]|uniref:Transposase IS30-like HTH domain-containing protein n=1 Tax=Bosea eneae TaxID=151454 RepID=A0ABW0J1M9_9HYPH
MASPRSSIDIEKLADLRERRGWSVKRIAEAMGKSPGAIAWQCLRHAIEPPQGTRTRDAFRPVVAVKRGNHIVRGFTAEEDKIIEQMSLNGATDSEIGRCLGRKPNSITGRLMTLARRQARAEA